MSKRIHRSKEFCKSLCEQLGRSRATYYRWVKDGIPARLLSEPDPAKEAKNLKSTLRRRDSELETLRGELAQLRAELQHALHQIELARGAAEEWRELAGMSPPSATPVRHSGFISIPAPALMPNFGMTAA